MEKVINKYFIVQGLKSLGMIFAFGVLFIDRIRVMSFHYEDCLYGVSGIENSISNCNGIMSALYYTYGFHIYLLLFLLISSGVLIFFYRKHIKNIFFFLVF